MQRGTGSALKGAGHGLTQLPTLSSSRQAGVHSPPDTRRQHPGTRGGEPLSPLPSLLPLLLQLLPAPSPPGPPGPKPAAPDLPGPPGPRAKALEGGTLPCHLCVPTVCALEVRCSVKCVFLGVKPRHTPRDPGPRLARSDPAARVHCRRRDRLCRLPERLRFCQVLGSVTSSGAGVHVPACPPGSRRPHHLRGARSLPPASGLGLPDARRGDRGCPC